MPISSRTKAPETNFSRLVNGQLSELHEWAVDRQKDIPRSDGMCSKFVGCRNCPADLARIDGVTVCQRYISSPVRNGYWHKSNRRAFLRDIELMTERELTKDKT